jgi:predicted DNA-binding protein
MADKKKHTAFRLSAMARHFLGELASERGLNSTAYLEMMIRERAKEAGLEYVPEKPLEEAEKPDHVEKSAKAGKASKTGKIEKNGG